MMSKADPKSARARPVGDAAIVPVAARPDPRPLRRGLAIEEPLRPEPARGRAAPPRPASAGPSRTAVSRAASGLPSAAAARGSGGGGPDDDEGAQLLPRMKVLQSFVL